MSEELCDIAESPVESFSGSASDQKSSDKKKISCDVPVVSVGMFGNIMNVLNCLLGAGILSVSSTFKDSGIVVGVVIMAFMAFLQHVGAVMVIELQLETKSSGLDEMAGKILGRIGAVILSIICIVFNGGACLSYLILGTDFIVSWFAAAGVDISSSLYRGITVLLYSLAMPVLLSIPRSLKFLSYFSTVVIFLIAFFCIVMMYKAGDVINESGVSPSVIVGKFDMGIFSSISVYALTFSMPVSLLPVLYGFEENAKKRNFSSWVSLLICFTLTAIPGILGYLMFGENIDGNILNNFADDDVLMIVVRVGFFLIVTMSYPITHPCVSCSWSDLIFGVNQAAELVGWRRALVLALSNGVTLIIAIFLPQVRPAIDLAGALGGNIGNFTLPAVMWFMSSKQKKSHWTNILSIAMAVFGCVTAVIGTYMAVISAVDAFRTVEF